MKIKIIEFIKAPLGISILGVFFLAILIFYLFGSYLAMEGQSFGKFGIFSNIKYEKGVEKFNKEWEDKTHEITKMYGTGEGENEIWYKYSEIDTNNYLTPKRAFELDPLSLWGYDCYAVSDFKFKVIDVQVWADDGRSTTIPVRHSGVGPYYIGTTTYETYPYSIEHENEVVIYPKHFIIDVSSSTRGFDRFFNKTNIPEFIEIKDIGIEQYYKAEYSKGRMIDITVIVSLLLLSLLFFKGAGYFSLYRGGGANGKS